MTKCLVCDSDPVAFRWTDAHGVAQCCRCGAPYRIFHYEGGKRVEKPPECLLLEEWVPRCRAYWQEAQRPMPGGYSLGYADSTQEVATRADAEAFSAWMDKHIPAEAK